MKRWQYEDAVHAAPELLAVGAIIYWRGGIWRVTGGSHAGIWGLELGEKMEPMGRKVRIGSVEAIRDLAVRCDRGGSAGEGFRR